jgi:gas vesicle protein
MSDKGSGGFFTGFFIGAIAGAAIALLYAPAPGDETRDYIRQKSIELKHQADEVAGDATHQAETLRTKGQAFLDEQKKRLQEAIDEGQKAAARRKAELLSQLEEQADDAVELKGESAEV